MSKCKKKPDLFTGTVSGKRHVLLAAVMTPAVALIDGLPIARFGDDPTWYLELGAAIDWLGREIGQSSQPQYLDELRLKLEILTAYKAAPDELLDSGAVQYDKDAGAFVAARDD